jgi:hypothetical protein
VGSIGSKLIKQHGVLSNIGFNRAGSVNVEKTPNEDLVLIMAKAFQDEVGKGFPRTGFKLCFNRLLLAGSILFTVHRSNPDPFEFLDKVEVKVVFTILKPGFRMFALEDRKIDLRKFSSRAPATTALITRVPMMRRWR